MFGAAMSEPVVIPADALAQIKSLLEISIMESRAARREAAADRRRIKRLERHAVILWAGVGVAGVAGWVLRASLG